MLQKQDQFLPDDDGDVQQKYVNNEVRGMWISTGETGKYYIFLRVLGVNALLFIL